MSGFVVGHGGKEDTAYGVVLKTSFRTAHLAFDVALIFVISYE